MDRWFSGFNKLVHQVRLRLTRSGVANVPTPFRSRDREGRPAPAEQSVRIYHHPADAGFAGELCSKLQHVPGLQVFLTSDIIETNGHDVLVFIWSVAACARSETAPNLEAAPDLEAAPNPNANPYLAYLNRAVCSTVPFPILLVALPGAPADEFELGFPFLPRIDAGAVPDHAEIARKIGIFVNEYATVTPTCDVFISHSQDDYRLALSLKTLLEDRSRLHQFLKREPQSRSEYRVFVFEMLRAPAENFVAKSEWMVQATDQFIYLISPASCDPGKTYCIDETQWAIKYGKRRIPVLYRPAPKRTKDRKESRQLKETVWPDDFNERAVISLLDWKKEEECLQRQNYISEDAWKKLTKHPESFRNGVAQIDEALARHPTWLTYHRYIQRRVQDQGISESKYTTQYLRLSANARHDVFPQPLQSHVDYCKSYQRSIIIRVILVVLMLVVCIGAAWLVAREFQMQKANLLSVQERRYADRIALLQNALYSADYDSFYRLGQELRADKALESWEGSFLLGQLPDVSNVPGVIATSPNVRFRSVDFSPSGKLLAAAGHDGQVIVWHRRPGTQKLVLQEPKGSGRRTAPFHRAGVDVIEFSPDGQWVVGARSDGIINFWKAGESALGARVGRITGVPGGVSALAIAPDSRLLATGGSDGVVRLWSLPGRKLVHSLRGHQDSIGSLAFTADGSLLVSGSEDRTARVWSLPGRRLSKTLAGHTGAVTAVAVSPVENLIATGCSEEDGFVRFWSSAATESSPLRTVRLPEPVRNGSRPFVTDLEFTPDGMGLAASSGTMGGHGQLLIWRVTTGAVQASMDTEGNPAAIVFNSHFGEVVAVTSSGKVIQHMTPARLTSSYRLTSALARVSFAAQSPVLGAGTETGDVAIWNVLRRSATAKSRMTIPVQDRNTPLGALACSPGGKRVAAAFGRQIRVWESGGKTLRNFLALPNDVRSLNFSPGGTQLGLVTAVGDVFLGDLGSDPVRLRKLGDLVGAGQVVFSPDGTRVAVAGERGAAVWHLNGGQRIITSAMAPVDSICFLPDSLGLALGGRTPRAGEGIAIWNPETNDLRRLSGVSSGVTSLAVTPNGRTLAAGSRDGLVRLWYLPADRPTLTLEGHGGSVLAVAFCSDGRFLVSVDDRGTVVVRDTIPPGMQGFPGPAKQ